MRDFMPENDWSLAHNFPRFWFRIQILWNLHMFQMSTRWLRNRYDASTCSMKTVKIEILIKFFICILHLLNIFAHEWSGTRQPQLLKSPYLIWLTFKEPNSISKIVCFVWITQFLIKNPLHLHHELCSLCLEFRLCM